jgi:hypothetical protein
MTADDSHHQEDTVIRIQIPRPDNNPAADKPANQPDDRHAPLQPTQERDPSRDTHALHGQEAGELAAEEPANAATRVLAYIEASGNGLYDDRGGPPLYGRDVETLARTVDRALADLADLRGRLGDMAAVRDSYRAERNRARAALAEEREELDQAMEARDAARGALRSTRAELERERRAFQKLVDLDNQRITEAAGSGPVTAPNATQGDEPAETAGRDANATDGPPRRLQLVVTYADDVSRYFPVGPDRGWKIDTTRRMLIVGIGVPRTMIPLDGVRYFEIDCCDCGHGEVDRG